MSIFVNTIQGLCAKLCQAAGLSPAVEALLAREVRRDMQRHYGKIEADTMTMLTNVDNVMQNHTVSINAIQCHTMLTCVEICRNVSMLDLNGAAQFL